LVSKYLLYSVAHYFRHLWRKCGTTIYIPWWGRRNI